MKKKEGKQEAPSINSVQQINEYMDLVKNACSKHGETIRKICVEASELFSTIFKGIKDISSKIAEHFKSIDATLAESKTVLNKYPKAEEKSFHQ